MDILITGCERSGTTWLSKWLGSFKNTKGFNEYKPVVAAFKMWQEINRWKDYEEITEKTEFSVMRYMLQHYARDERVVVDKHSLNTEQNIEFLKFIKRMFPEVKIIYLVRDGRDVVSSMMKKKWGGTLKGKKVSRRSKRTAISNYETVITETYEWAQENCMVVRYEDLVNGKVTGEDICEYLEIKCEKPLEIQATEHEPLEDRRLLPVLRKLNYVHKL